MPGKTTLLVRLILLTRGFDACQDRKAQKYDPAHRNPALRNMQYDGAINQPADYDQESHYVKAK
jgi:hypothetical protein